MIRNGIQMVKRHVAILLDSEEIVERERGRERERQRQRGRQRQRERHVELEVSLKFVGATWDNM